MLKTTLGILLITLFTAPQSEVYTCKSTSGKKYNYRETSRELNSDTDKEKVTVSTAQSEVYLCKSTGGKKYHYKETCRGLNSCTHKIEKVTLKEAQNLGKTLCGWEK